MQSKRFWILPLLLLSLASMPILAQESTKPSNPQSSTPSPSLTVPSTMPDGSPTLILSETQYKALVKSAVDKATSAVEATVPARIDEAVKAAVAQKEGERAKAQSLADQWKAEADSQYRKQLGRDAIFFGIGGLLVELVNLAVK